jgi:hypothetical protein
MVSGHRLLEYAFGCPGVGSSVATWVPTACARVNAVASVMPLPAIAAPAACARASGAETVILAPPAPPAIAAMTAVSWFAPASIVIV